MSFTHSDLVKRAAKWLRNTMKCGVVVTEEHSMGFEIPDAIGWKSYESILVECKVSRSDFLRDRKKLHRRDPDLGMGDRRYYMAPPGLIKREELPETWGLLEVHPKIVRVIHGSYGGIRYKAAFRERPLIYRLLKKMQEG